MGAITAYFFDSYAFFEILSGNPNYLPFMKDIAIITTKMNLMELHYRFILLHGQVYADQVYDTYSKLAINVDDAAIKKANCMKAAYRQRKLSYVDCLGYIVAKDQNIRFLTGDRQFKDMENVEYVK